MEKIYNAVPLRKRPLGLLKLIGGFILILFLLKLLFGIGTIIASLLVGTIFGFILGRKF
tara:strand:- start:273 stop:449 length:177 start_codon:yes stop_codon:yes gene_type:complete